MDLLLLWTISFLISLDISAIDEHMLRDFCTFRNTRLSCEIHGLKLDSWDGLKQVSEEKKTDTYVFLKIHSVTNVFNTLNCT